MTKRAPWSRSWWWLLPFVPACGTVRDWRELKTEPMTIGACYDGLEFIAAGGGFRADPSGTDRGLGTWLSRWRYREQERNFPIRNRLRAEILVDQGSTADGWVIRYRIEQEKVKDLRQHRDPQEKDWSGDGQDVEGEALFGDRLARRLAPKSVPSAASPRPTLPGY